MLGRALASAGSGSGLTARPLGSFVGSEKITLTVNEMPNHQHNNADTVNGDIRNPASGNQLVGVTDSLGSNVRYGNIAAEGGGAPHDNVQPTSFVNFYIKM